MSQTRFFKSVITPTLVQPTENHQAGVASGMWSLQDQARARRGGVWPEAGVTNPDTLVENVFSTFLYTGNGSAASSDSQTITNGIDLSGDGGLVWIKSRAVRSNALYDTERGNNSGIYSDSANAENAAGFGLSKFLDFNSNGFAPNNANNLNYSGEDYCSWTFKKASKFFDVVTYTGNGTSGRTVSHNLGAVPGMMIVKHVSQSDHWMVYHRGLGNTKYINLSLANAAQTASSAWNDTDPTATEFTLGNAGSVNQNGSTYVAYLFGHDTSSDGMIQCGYYTGDGGAGTTTVDLGFEPQWILVKASSAADNWYIIDNMRGWATHDNTANDEYLYANENNAEATAGVLDITSTGFKTTLYSNANVNGRTYIYMAIRRGPMATPTAASDVFAIDSAQSSSSNPAFTSSTLVDFLLTRPMTSSSWAASARLTGTSQLYTNNTSAEGTSSSTTWDYNTGAWDAFSASSSYQAWMWSRAPGYFDVVAYTGTGSARTVAHNLGVVPEMMWVKRRNNTGSWNVFHTVLGNTKATVLNATDESFTSSDFWNNTSPTSSVFTVGTGTGLNGSGDTYIAYLFATLAGVSKVGSFTGDGTSGRVIDCGFTSGAKLIIIKPVAGVTGGWSLYDTTSGIIAGDDPVLYLNSNVAKSLPDDDVDADSSGFIVNYNALGNYLNADSVTYLFYAIAT